MKKSSTNGSKRTATTQSSRVKVQSALADVWTDELIGQLAEESVSVDAVKVESMDTKIERVQKRRKYVFSSFLLVRSCLTCMVLWR